MRGTRRNFKGILSLILVIAVGGTYLQTTLAANISLNSGLVVNFGQGVAATTACSGSTSLIVTPISSFQNVSGGGAFYFKSVKVSNVPTSCYGKDFIINAYNTSSSTPLAIFNSTSTSAVVYNNAGTFEAGSGMTGATVSPGTGTFTVTFTTPVATASTVFKLTIQSSNHTEAAGGYIIGDTGPGGGRIFYYSATGFNCGPNYTDTCNYLEVAPSIWSGLFESDANLVPTVREKDSRFTWAIESKEGDLTPGISGFDSVANGLLVSEIGLGYRNSMAIVTQNGPYNFSANRYGAGAARAYTGGSKSDWYLPTFSEINLLCQWAKGIPQSATNLCGGGTSNIEPTQTGAGFELLWDSSPDAYPRYMTSSTHSGYVSDVWTRNMYNGGSEEMPKGNVTHVRPIRAF